MGIARSTYYDAARPMTPRSSKRSRRFARRRVHAALRQQGMIVNHKKIKRLMRENGPQPRICRYHVATTDSDHDQPIFPNRAKDMTVDGPDQRCAACCATSPSVRMALRQPPGGHARYSRLGVAGSGRFPMRWLSAALGPDELVGMAYCGQGIGRYFGANTFGQDALSNIGLPGVVDVSLDALPTYGASAGYRHFWTPQLRSNFVYSYAWQEYPSYALFFVPGSASATLLNSTMQQGIVNLIWSPFAELRGNTVGTGWIDSVSNMSTHIGMCLAAR